MDAMCRFAASCVSEFPRMCREADSAAETLMDLGGNRWSAEFVCIFFIGLTDANEAPETICDTLG